jgi:hypothetical protein
MCMCINITWCSRGQHREKSVVGSSGGCESIMMSGGEDEMGRGEPIVGSADYEALVMPKNH